MGVVRKFNLYYLGTTQNYANRQFLMKVKLEIPDITYTGTPPGSQTIGTTSTNGTVTLNSNGVALNNQYPFSKWDVIGPSTTGDGYATYTSRMFSAVAHRIYDVLAKVTSPAIGTYYYFAFSNETYYATAALRKYSNGYEFGATSFPICYCSNNATYGGRSPFVFPCVPYYKGYTSGVCYAQIGIHKTFYVNGTLKQAYVYGYTWTSTQNLSLIWSNLNSYEVDFINGGELVPDPPYEGGGDSSVNYGGTGTFDSTSDSVVAPSLPTVTIADAGFVRVYNPTLAQLQSLASYMWTDSTFLQTIVNHAKQLLENPIEAIISLNIVPCAIPHGTDQAVKVLFVNTGVNMPPVTTQFVEVDCGTYQVKEFYGSALDYSPYTRIHCFLPYIGQVTLDTDEVMGKTLSIRYRIDILTGVCVALISVNSVVMYQFSGHCAISMPLTSADFSNYINAAIQSAKAIAGVAAGAAGAGGVASALLGTPAPSSSTKTHTYTTRNPKTGRQITSGTETVTRETAGASFGEMATKGAVNTVGAVMGSKLIVEHAGGFTGNSGYLGVRRPYLIFEIPRMCNPADYGVYNGYPSMITLNLDSCEGFTQVQSIHLTNIPATNPELSEISELLKAGVVL